MRGPLPKSLGGQLILLLLAALTVSHLLGFLIFAGERRQAMRAVHHMELLERTAAIVRVLETTSPGARGEILRAVTLAVIGLQVDRDVMHLDPDATLGQPAHDRRAL